MNKRDFGEPFGKVQEYFGRVGKQALTDPQRDRYFNKCQELGIKAGRWRIICNEMMDRLRKFPTPSMIVMLHKELPWAQNTIPQKDPCDACDGCGWVSVRIRHVGGIVFTNPSGELTEPVNDMSFRCSCTNADKYKDSGCRLDVAYPDYDKFGLVALRGWLRSAETDEKVIIEMIKKDGRNHKWTDWGNRLEFEPRKEFDKGDPKIRHLEAVAKRVSDKKQMPTAAAEISKEWAF